MKSALVVRLLGLSFLLVTPTETSQRSCSAGRIHKSGKACGERFNQFLHDVLQAREGLIWIDQVAGQMRSTELFHANPGLQEKLNAMFFNSEARVWAPEKNMNVITHQRHRRHSEHTQNSSPKRNGNPTHGRNVLANKKNSNSPKHEHNAGALLQRNFNSTMKSTQKIRTKNGIATTADPLEKILQSINVFPVEDDRDARGGDVAALKFNDDTAENDFQSRVFEHEAAGVSQRGRSNEAFSENHSRMRRSLKSMAAEADAVENNVAKSFNSEYDIDQGQIKRAMNGDLAKEIVDTIFNELKVKGGFDAPMFISQYYTQPVNSMLVESSNRKINLASTNENEIITKKIMAIVQQLISEEVEKKSCALLPSELHSFLEWLIEIDIDNNENFDLLRQKTNNILGNKSTNNNNSMTNLGEWYHKAQSLKNLLNQYDGLSRKERNKVQAIYEYLASRFEFAEAYIKSLEAHELPVDQLIKFRTD